MINVSRFSLKSLLTSWRIIFFLMAVLSQTGCMTKKGNASTLVGSYKDRKRTVIHSTSSSYTTAFFKWMPEISEMSLGLWLNDLWSATMRDTMMFEPSLEVNPMKAGAGLFIQEKRLSYSLIDRKN